MKKIICFILTILMFCSMAACGGEEENDAVSSAPEAVKSEAAEVKEENSTGIEVDEKLLNVDITLPASFFEDMTPEEIIAEAEEQGIKKCEVAEDGTVTYTMSKARHEELIKELKDGLDKAVEELLDGEDAVASFVSIDAADDFSNVDIYVDPELYSSWDSMYALSFYMVGAYYQSFAGTDADDIDVVVNFIDNNSGEVVNTASYKAFMESAASAESAE